MTNAEELALSCVGAPSAFIESMVAGYSAIFESDAANPQGGNETVPVNTQNVVGSEEASAIPAQLKAAQDSAKAVDAEQEKLDSLKATADQQVQDLRDTLAVASEQPTQDKAATDGQAQ